MRPIRRPRVHSRSKLLSFLSWQIVFRAVIDVLDCGDGFTVDCHKFKFGLPGCEVKREHLSRPAGFLGVDCHAALLLAPAPALAQSESLLIQ